MQEYIKILYSDSISKSKSSQKIDKTLTKLRDLSAFQQNVIFALGKSIKHITDTIFVQASNTTLLCHDSYLEHLKSGVKPDTWFVLRNNPLQHTVLFLDTVITKAKEDIAKTEADRFQPYRTDWSCCKDGFKNKSIQEMDQSRDSL